MSIRLTIDPPIPVEVVGEGIGQAVEWVDYGEHEPLHWVVIINRTQEMLMVVSSEVRLLKNVQID